jgi:hypothetical protein
MSIEYECVEAILKGNVQSRMIGEILSSIEGVGLMAREEHVVKNLIRSGITRNIKYALLCINEMLEETKNG